jgi:hypothetical protein
MPPVSNRRKTGQPPPQHPVTALIAPLDGARIPGGCDHCDAYQVVTASVQGHRNVHMITVCHDDDCPWLAVRKAGTR